MPITLADTLAVTLAAVVLTGCSAAAAIRPADVERQITDGLSEQVGGEFEVTCPSALPAEAGYTFTCAVADRTGGGTLTVTVVEDDDTGTFTWRVAQ